MTRFWRRFSPQQFFLISLPFALIFAVAVLGISGKRFLAKRPCGCGLPTTSVAGSFDPGEKIAFWDNQKVSYPLSELLALSQKPEKLAPILGETTEEQWVEIDLSEQKLFAHEGNRIVYEFLVSSGKPWTPTVKGEFRIWSKFRYAKMSGGSKENGTYYYLPNVPFIQYFHKDYGLHGAYWHNNFGHTMSHGCVNLSIPDSEILFNWTRPLMPEGKNMVLASAGDPGTRVVIHD